ncbi:5-(carboxyamino)imidazole ribonucleotide synthase [Dasania marina]|uniref:5-(carboxyamino)imidazole ribonucleotide synthase n=1 Tax=Dasania marina TaxID=471499 RepID=UPI0003786A35|nr:5-(carboxyamino)imidazole ribonucleotide synthase [Dasania marina]
MKSLLILGHGQLGLMMAAEAARLGLVVDRLDMQTGELLCGTTAQRLKVDAAALIADYDVITAEIEHLPHSEWLDRIYASDKWANRLAFELLPNRYSQKTLLDQLQVPTAPWCVLESRADVAKAHQQLGEALIVKSTTGGYDGKGQWRVSPDNGEQLPEAMFGQLIAEQKIPFQREVSVIGARDVSGHSYFLPMAENIHREGILRYSLANVAVDDVLQQQAEAALGNILDHLDFVGIMAMECFVTEQGLLVNELAPRVHNTGHWTQMGAVTNQFAMQVLPLVGLPLPQSQNCKPTLMLNLIGCEFSPACISLPCVSYHWYGKEVRPGRKLGHINIDASCSAALKKAVTVLSPHLDAEHQDLLAEAVELHRQRSAA